MPGRIDSTINILLQSIRLCRSISYRRQHLFRVKVRSIKQLRERLNQIPPLPNADFVKPMISVRKTTQSRLWKLIHANTTRFVDTDVRASETEPSLGVADFRDEAIYAQIFGARPAEDNASVDKGRDIDACRHD